MNLRLLLFLLTCSTLHAQDYPRAAEFHGKVKSVEERSYKARKHHGTITSGRAAHEYSGELDFMLGYDSLGRTISRTMYSNRSGQASWSIQYSYDSAGNAVQSRRYQHKQGLTNMTNYVNTYDQQGRLIFRTAKDPEGLEQPRSWVYTYDANGFITEQLVTDSLHPANGLKMRYLDRNWNALKQWDYVNTKLTYYMELEYDSSGNKTAERLYHRRGHMVYAYHWKYSAKNELERFENCESSAHNCESWNYKYEYDAAGNWIKRIEYRNGKPRFVRERTLTYY